MSQEVPSTVEKVKKKQIYLVTKKIRSKNLFNGVVTKVNKKRMGTRFSILSVEVS